MVFKLFFKKAFLALIFSMYMLNGYSQTLTVVGNNTGYTSVSTKVIKDVFKGKYSLWSNKESIIIVLPSSKAVNAEAVAKYLYGTTFSGMQKYWLSLVFQGRANPPVFLDSDDEIIEYVKENSGAVGIVSSTNKNITNTIKISISD
jgi:ABC-type phosphate transport system substrate-binding protein